MITDFSLTGRERDILEILWQCEEGMIASDFPKIKEDLTINTVQAILKKLLKRELIEVKEIVYSGTVLCRRYVPAISEQDFSVEEISQGIRNLKRFGITPGRFFIEYLDGVDCTEEEAEALLKLLREIRES